MWTLRNAFRIAACLLVGDLAIAAEFVPLGVGAWESSGSDYYYSGESIFPSDFVYPIGKTPDDAFYYDFENTKRLPGGGVAEPTTVWEHGFSSVTISDNGRVITGEGTSAGSPYWYRFGEDGSAEDRLVYYDYFGGDGIYNIDLAADGLTGLAARVGCCVSRDRSFGINSGIASPTLSYQSPLPPELEYWQTQGFMEGGTAISGDGAVLIGVENSGAVFRWQEDDSQFQVLDGMTDATDLSYNGSVVVGGAKWWTAETGARYFGPEPTDDFTYGAVAVSADGAVIAGTMTVDSEIQAFRWTASGGFEGLGNLPGGEDFSRATGMSADGATIIGMTSTDRGMEPFRWNAATGMQSVADLLVDGGADLQGYELIDVPNDSFYSHITGVSGDGTVLVGTVQGGAPNYTGNAWLARIAIVPEPSSAILFTVGSTALSMGFSRRQLRDNPR